MEEYYQTIINDLRNKLKEKNEVIKSLEQKLDKTWIMQELEKEKKKNKELEQQLKVEKDSQEDYKKKRLLYSLMKLKEEQ
jgi:hypothetical protein